MRRVSPFWGIPSWFASRKPLSRDLRASLHGASRIRTGDLPGARGQLAREAAAATLAGWAIGVGVTSFVAAQASAPVGGVLAHSVAAGNGIAVALGLACAAALVLLLALHVPVAQVGRLSISALDVAALAALAAVGLALARGAADANELAREGGTGVLLFVLPALIAFVAAVALLRLLGPFVRLLERGARRLSISGRLAALSLARDPGLRRDEAQVLQCKT
jgi:hypothetical protein